jgi:hypothetical protein
MLENENLNEAENPQLNIAAVSGSLPNWWDLQIEQLKELEKVIEKRIKELEGNDR